MRRETPGRGGGEWQGKVGRDFKLKGQKTDMRGRQGNGEGEDEPNWVEGKREGQMC